ncbi:MAG: hypothetical protein ABF289_10210 [Clostridiales bacterium]
MHVNGDDKLIDIPELEEDQWQFDNKRSYLVAALMAEAVMLNMKTLRK